MLLGWAGINSKGKTSIADNTDNIYAYARNSPEWFAQFIAEGSHIPANDPLYDKSAYAKRDYEAARHNLENLCHRLSSRDETEIAEGKAYPNLTVDERNYLFDFFEKYWHICAGEDANLMVALIEKNALQGRYDNHAFESFGDYQEAADRIGVSQVSIARAIEFLIDSEHHDKQIDYAIPPTKLHIVSLPSYNALHFDTEKDTSRKKELAKAALSFLDTQTNVS